MTETHGDAVTSLVFSRDGTRLVSTSADEKAFVWDVDVDADGGSAAPKLLRLEGHDDWVRGATVSPDGRLVATASDDETVRVWDIAAAEPEPRVASDGEESAGGVPVRVFKGHTDYVFGVAFSPDGRRLASVGDDFRVLIWDLAGAGHKTKPDGDMSDPRPLRFRCMRGVVFSAGGSSMVTVNAEGDVAVWRPDLPEGKHCVWLCRPRIPFTSMRIDEYHPDMLLTEFGVWPFDVSEAELEKLAAGTSSELPRRGARPTWSPVDISLDGRWITWNGRKLIFLPAKFRPTYRLSPCLVQGLCVVIGCESGQVVLFRLSKDVSPDDPEQRWWGPPSGCPGL